MPQPIITLPQGPLDIIGDVHGEIDALNRLLHLLGHSCETSPPRTLVFVGDLVDRGPNSPAVVHKVRQLVAQKKTIALLGNHELNLLLGSPRDGNSWFFDFHEPHYPHMAKASSTEKNTILSWVASLPLIAMHENLIIAHACPAPDVLHTLQQERSIDYLKYYYTQEHKLGTQLPWADDTTRQLLLEQSQRWDQANATPSVPPPYLGTIAAWQAYQQNKHPLRCVTSGMEHPIAEDKLFYVGGKWRFTDRTPWWCHPHLVPDRPCVIGHYWRKPPVRISPSGKAHPETPLPSDPQFAAADPLSWFGYKSRVFCIDYSAGLNFKHRTASTPLGDKAQLAALQWPENQIVFDCGLKLPALNRI